MTTATIVEQHATWRRTRTGEWVLYSTHEHLTACLATGGTVPVITKAGAVSEETIGRVGGAFDVDGTAMAYGHIAEPDTCDDCGATGVRVFYVRSDASSGLSGYACGQCYDGASFG